MSWVGMEKRLGSLELLDPDAHFLCVFASIIINILASVCFRTNLPGLMFDEHSMRSDYGVVPLMATGAGVHGQPSQPDSAMRYSPPRSSTSH